MLAADVAPNTEAPWWRLPTAGGGQYVRIAYVQGFDLISYLLKTSSIVGGQQTLWVPHSLQSFYNRVKRCIMLSGVGLRLRTAENGPTIYRMILAAGSTGTNISVNVSEFSSMNVQYLIENLGM